ncbi:hypothetical protein M569_17166, partial [Genlisea aurea]
VIFLSVTAAPASVADSLSDALLAFKSEIIDESDSLSDWVLPPDPPASLKSITCSWVGVRCDESSGKIIALDLSMKNLGGSLSGEGLNLLTHLRHLNLSRNFFSDRFPASVFAVGSLTTLDISRNNFSGEFPAGISNLTNLVALDAFSNGFTGCLPGEIAAVPSLRSLNFAGSYFSGGIPAGYGGLKNLEFMHLGGNYLSGKIPPELGLLSRLRHMEIGYNSFDGGIPPELGNLTALTYLDISGSNVSGSIPVELCNLTNMESLFLFRNMLSGEIPTDFSKMSPLKSLDLSDNLISGSIPHTLSQLKNLTLLSLMYNDLSGSVPPELSQLPNLESLLIWNNYLTGELPHDLGRFSNLRHVDVSTNFLSGTIPESICRGGELQKLIMFSNNFSGSLSPSLSNCSSLVRIRLEGNSFSGAISLDFRNACFVDLSGNEFSGGIPSEIVRADGLEYLNVSHNEELGGVVPPGLFSLPNLRNISMASCGLSGDLPPLEGCESVSVIEFGTNGLSGSIPESISNCKHLSRMDLSRNRLNGSIPIEFRDISGSLKLLNVSYNDISGPIPESLEGMDRTAFVGNPLLCGSPLTLRCDRRDRNSAWIPILISASALFIFGAVLAILLHHRRRRKGSGDNWETISFQGERLPHFTPKDVLTGFSREEKVVLPTGIAVSARRIEWQQQQPDEMGRRLRVLIRIGTAARHRNLTRMLGICYNDRFGYVLYECFSPPHGRKLSDRMRLKLDWESKWKILCGIAEGLSFLHHDCYPSIPHGRLDAGNVILDEKSEPRLVDYGLESVDLYGETDGGFIRSLMEKLYADVYSYGELILATVTNGRRVSWTSTEALISEMGVLPPCGGGTQVRRAVEVAFSCIRRRPADRPSMQDVVKIL